MSHDFFIYIIIVTETFQHLGTPARLFQFRRIGRQRTGIDLTVFRHRHQDKIGRGFRHQAGACQDRGSFFNLFPGSPHHSSKVCAGGIDLQNQGENRYVQNCKHDDDGPHERIRGNPSGIFRSCGNLLRHCGLHVSVSPEWISLYL